MARAKLATPAPVGVRNGEDVRPLPDQGSGSAQAVGLTAAAHKTLAFQAVERGNPAAAIPHLRMLTQLMPEQAWPWRMLARCLTESGNCLPALAAWRRVAALHPGDGAHAPLASLFHYLGRAQEAETHLVALAGAAPDDIDRWRRLARCRAEFDDRAGEAVAWERLLSLGPDDAEAATALAAAKARARALARIRADRAVWRDDGTDDVNRAETAQARGDIAGAVIAWRRAQRGSDQSRAGPTFMIIGAPRAGTSWMKKALAGHPAVFITPDEGHYFSGDLKRPLSAYADDFALWRGQYLDKTARAFRHRGKDAALGEKSPTYLLIPADRIALCAARFPDLRLICMVRDPAERLKSHLRHLGMADRGDDLRFLRSSRAPTRLAKLLDYGRYRRHLTRWAAFYPARQIHLVGYDQLIADPQEAYAGTLAHLGLEPTPLAEHLLVRPAPHREPDWPTLHRFLEGAYDEEPHQPAELRRAMEQLGRI